VGRISGRKDQIEKILKSYLPAEVASEMEVTY